MSENNREPRLPPPAFPPGSRRHQLRNQVPEVKAKVQSVDEALIGPDDPLPDRVDLVGDAFISPDDPLPERTIELAEAFWEAHAAAADEEGEVVGMDLDPHLQPSESVSGGDPHVTELMTAVAKLAEAVQRKGEAGLRATLDMSRFEATLRAYCVGYLAGRRSEEPPRPHFEEALPTDG
ncbi:MAG: hypothetical protein HKN72_06395 [Gemmatimonadetes bacterium]|nr:hypothetical protein [Gemmatimonadota bacterium]NNF12830.1 hypothetical protein [Gemmatimonadota bacterium]